MSLILMTTLFYKALILHGEIWRWSLLGLKGLNEVAKWKTCLEQAQGFEGLAAVQLSTAASLGFSPPLLRTPLLYAW